MGDGEKWTINDARPHHNSSSAMHQHKAELKIASASNVAKMTLNVKRF